MMNNYVPLFVIDTAHLCAWRAMYICVRRVDRGYAYRAQIAHIGIDPTASPPAVFGGVSVGQRGFSFRLRIPFGVWKYQESGLRRWIRGALQRLDGRFVA